MNYNMQDNFIAEGARSQASRIVIPFLLFVSLLLTWEFFVRAFHVPEYVLPAPTVILSALHQNLPYYLHHAWVTMLEALVGLSCACLFGVLAAICISLKPGSERAALPLLVAIQAIPIVALAPLMILWFGPGLSSKAVMAALLCFFPMALNTIKGLRAIPAGAIDLLAIYHVPRFTAFRVVVLPYALPFVLAGVRISASMAMIGAIVAEYAGANQGLGYLIMQSTYRVDTPLVFGAIVMAALASWLFYGSIILIENTALRRLTHN